MRCDLDSRTSVRARKGAAWKVLVGGVLPQLYRGHNGQLQAADDKEKQNTDDPALPERSVGSCEFLPS